MAKRTRIPTLNPAELEAFETRLAQSGVSVGQQRTIMASLRTAANPNAETPEYGIASLPPDRRRIAERSVRDSAAVFSFGYNFAVPFDEQSEFNEELATAQAEDSKALEWAIVLALLAYFLFPKEQESMLYESILNAYVSAWQLAIKEQAAKYGCPNARIGSPSGASLREIKRLVKRDADSIAKTYNENAQNALRKLYDANPLGNVAYYVNGMAQWANTRQLQKNLTIGINNVQVGYQLGLQDFHVNNQLQTEYRFSGAPPVCPICSKLMSLGAVDYQTMASNFCPVHSNCPHYWVSTKAYKIPCATMWTG
jgi:hypothetical protein